MKRLAIIGSGNLGQLIAHYATVNGEFELSGFFDDFEPPKRKVGLGVILGGTELVFELYKKGLFDEIIMAVGYNHFEFRKKKFDELKVNIPFANIISPSAYIDKTCKLGDGIVISPGCILDRNVIVGDNVFFNIGCAIGHDSTIQTHSYISVGVAIAGFVNVGQCCFLGLGTKTNSKIKICDFSKTGAGAVVIKDTTKRAWYVGMPAKAIEKNK